MVAELVGQDVLNENTLQIPFDGEGDADGGCGR